MKYFSPGASVKDDYAHVCDNCKTFDGRATLIWSEPEFVLCFECLRKLFFEHVVPQKKAGERIVFKRAMVSESLRDEVYQRDGHKCCDCGSSYQLQLDHIFPFSEGGTTDIGNLRTLCRKCNTSKRNKVVLWREAE